MNESKNTNTVDRLDNVAPEFQITVRLLNLVNKTKYEIVQENGQRRLTAPELSSMKQERIKGAEVFIGRLPNDCYEDELMPVLEKVGRLLELRLMLEFSGHTRKYAFALFKDAKTARRACEVLNKYEIRPGRRIGVVKSIDNCRLFFGGVPKNKTKEEFLEELTKLLDGIVDIHVYPNVQDRTKNRGFIFVEFKDHRSAAMARRKLSPGKVNLWDHDIAVDWAEPEPGDPIDDEVMKTVTALFIRNLSLEITQQQLKDILQNSTNISILKIKKMNHFAFVHYETRESAEQVLQILMEFNGVAEENGWEVQWAKPVATFKKSERQKCIIEAFRKNNQERVQYLQKEENSFKKQNIIQSELSFNDRKNLSVSEMLSSFVMNHLQGQCYFEVLQSSDNFGYICKVSIIKNHCIYFEHYGNIMITKAEAIEKAAQAVYDILCSHFNTFVPISYLPTQFTTTMIRNPIY